MSHERFDVTVQGTRLRVATRGEGTPILLINGVGANLSIWGPLARQMPDRRVISFDAPGIGGSDAPRRPMRLPALADLTRDLIAELGYDRIDVVGHSLGGMIALELAHRSPERVRRLVLCNTAPGLPLLLSPNPLAYAAVFTPLRSRLLVSAAAGGRTARDPALTEKMASNRTDRPSWTGLLRQLYAAPGWSSWPWLHRIQHQTLVVVGSEDPLILPANSRLLAWRMPNATLRTVPGGGHLLSLDQPEAFAQLIDEFAPAD
jgi:pimeloyl-ACP methyl ester carboxylesterase